MQKINLYDVPQIEVPSFITSLHWQDLALQAEDRFNAFFDLDHAWDCLMVDRATHGIWLAAMALRQRGHKDFCVPLRTYRAAPDAIHSVGCHAGTSAVAEFNHGCVNLLDDMREAKIVTVPTTLGGTFLDPDLIPDDYPVIYDCAHTGHPAMFDNVKSLCAGQFIVLSFYPTKPLGAFGGGLVVALADEIADIRSKAWPITYGENSAFFYPQSIQSWGAMHRIRTFDPEYHKANDARIDRLIQLVEGNTPSKVQWPVHDALSPHLLTFTYSERLKWACIEACLEMGDHYPPVQTGEAVPLHLSIPFHTDEVQSRLEAVLCSRI